MHSFHVELLHGLDGTEPAHRLAELREPTGRDQALLANLNTASPARCVSALIATLVLRIGECSPTTEGLLGLTAGDRERLLLAICSRLFGAETDLVASCPTCKSLVEVAIRFGDLLSARPHSLETTCSLAAKDGQWTAEIAPPTGANLERTLAAGPRAARQLLEDCLIKLLDAQGASVSRDCLPVECEVELAEKLLALDPLAECSIAVECPHCATTFETLLDGFALLKTAIGGADQLYGDVYRMARSYHWSEADILALPLARRAHYLAIAAAAEAGA